MRSALMAVLVLIGCAPASPARMGQPDGPESTSRACLPTTPPFDTVTHESSSVTTRALPRRVPPLIYPTDLRNRGVEGRVILHVWIEPTGTVDSLALDSASDAGFVQSAAATVLHATFWPACVGDRPVRYTEAIPVRFQLRAFGPPPPIQYQKPTQG